MVMSISGLHLCRLVLVLEFFDSLFLRGRAHFFIYTRMARIFVSFQVGNETVFQAFLVGDFSFFSQNLLAKWWCFALLSLSSHAKSGIFILNVHDNERAICTS